MPTRRSFLFALSAANARLAWGSSLWRPILQNLQHDAAAFVFHTGQTADPEVQWRSLPDGEDWRAAKIARQWLIPPDARALSPLAKITARLDRLPAGGKVECRLLTAALETGTRWTLQVPAAHQLRGDILVIGDSGSAGEAQQAVLGQMQRVPLPEMVIHTGDLAYPSANFSSLREHYFDPYAGFMAETPFYPAIGNHDTPEDQAAAVVGMHDIPVSPGVAPQFAGRYYSFVRGPVQFFVLDSNEPLLEHEGANPMLRWLRTGLERSRSFWRIAVFHHTPYPAGRHAGDRLCRMARESVMPLLERFEVPLVLCGHEHVYKRTAAPAAGKTGTMVVTTGGGGGGLYPAELTAPNVFAKSVHHFVRIRIEGVRMTIQAVDGYGEVFDEARLAPPPSVRNIAWEPGSAIHIEGLHLALPDGECGAQLELNRQPVEPVHMSATSIELPFSELAPPSGELVVRNANGERVITLDPHLI